MKLDQIGKYKIVDKIGQGAMGEVFRAHDPVLNRFVAIKTLSAALGADEDRLKRFRREAQSAAKLNHPNIITVYDFGEEQGHLYMAMELLEGRDLSDVIRTGELDVENTVDLMEQICEAVAFAHAAGVVHRDLKPANIHVLGDGQIKVMDFGLARFGGSSEMTRAGAVMGTPNYMAPEQVRGERVDSRADVFSLGAVFHEMLSGNKAFEADSLHGVLYKVMDETPPALSRIAPHVPAPLAAFVERALDKDPARRFRDAGEMRSALGRWRDLGSDLDATVAGEGSATQASPGTEATMLEARGVSTHPSLTRSRTRAPVTGATALDLERVPAGRTEARDAPRIASTLSGRSSTRVESDTAAPSRRLRYGGIAVVGLAIAVGAVALAVHYWGERPAAPDTGREEAGALTEVLVDSRVELARVDLQNKNYESAIHQAEQALAVQPTNAAARSVVDEARKSIAERDTVAAEAKAAYQRGDTEAASKALAQLLTLDPRHPVAGELSQALNEHFSKQAEDARRAMDDARSAAQRQAPQGAEGLAEAGAMASEAERLLGDRQYAVAAQKFMESRDGFERARRAAETAALKARMAAASPRPPVVVATGAPPVTVGTLPPPTVPSARPSPPAPTPPTVASPGPPAAGQDGAIRHVIADYARAIEAKDVGLFKSVKPNLSPDDEKRLMDAFKAVKSQQVAITVDSVDVEGGKATVRIHRQDTINGRELKANQQTFTLVQAGGAWRIETIGQ